MRHITLSLIYFPPTSGLPPFPLQVLFVRPGGVASQTIFGLVAESGRYSISFAVGRRLDRPFPATANAEVRAQPSNTVVASVALTENDVAAGAFVPAGLDFTLSGSEAYIGEELVLSFFVTGIDRSQALFDNVRMTTQFVAVQDPPSVLPSTIIPPETMSPVLPCAAGCRPR